MTGKKLDPPFQRKEIKMTNYTSLLTFGIKSKSTKQNKTGKSREKLIHKPAGHEMDTNKEIHGDKNLYPLRF